MKTIFQKTIIVSFATVLFFSATHAVFADDWIDQNPATYQYNYNTYSNPNIDFVTSPTYPDPNPYLSNTWSDQSPSTYQYNYNTYSNPNIDTVTSNCIGCSTAPTADAWINQNPATYQYNYNTYSNPNIDTVTSNCVGCTTGTWGGTTVAPTLDTSSWGGTTVAPTVSTLGWGGTTVSPVTDTLLWGGTTVAPVVDPLGWGGTTVAPATVTSPSYTYTPGYTYTSPTVIDTTYQTSGSYTSPTYGTVGSTYGTGYTYPTSYIAPTLYGSTGYGYVGSINTGNYGYIGSTYNNNNTTTYTNAWCQSIGWDYVTDTVHGYCQCNTGRSYSGDLTTGRGGVCRPIQTSCTQEVKQCPDGSYVSRTEPGCNFAACPVPTPTPCPTGSSRIGNACVADCPTGTNRSANGTCVNNVVITTYTCPNGSVVSYSFQCPIITPAPTYTYPSYTYPTAPTYSYSGSSYGYGYTAPAINYQVCWDGSTISGNQICPAQYKTCLNGSYVAFNQSCYAITTPNYIAPPVVKFNNVVTSIITQITNTSGRCNGIGLIANGADSTGWFEYGETANLGRVTAKASIGRDLTAPFSNVLANLKPTTKYYCRAVMQNQYGIVKGEIVSFVTKSKVTSYVKPVVATKKTVTKKAVTTKKSEVVCVDGSYVSVKNESSATMLNQGEKLMMLQVEKGEGNLTANSHVSYRIMYRNLSNARLTGVLVKVVIPAELKFTSATAGNYDDGTHTLTLNQDSIDAYSEGVITIRGDISSDAPVGKTIVTTAYALYTVPGTHAQDEVTAYVVGSILPASNVSNLDTGAKKVIGSDNDRGFMPSNLVEWLALIAIIFIIFILGRSIYVSYKEGDGKVEKH